ncbi:DUF1361 domain-containing protein [Algibacter sp. L1A34]|uniref:DUF1361 domain-containing protein n=1 Tax=Algibacter sp. L1A34 TaxID=2686365 RepID=UPI00131D4148|nr:DUF1361 domain-containing protein [Algibacter sp. L1A34]
MNYINNRISYRYKSLALLSVSISSTLILLMIRMKLAHSDNYLFLVWNLFLAAIPYAITIYLVSVPKLKKITLLLAFVVWLFFLPNAPYILTDMWHLRYNQPHIFWLDILLISAFALNGMMLFYFSVTDMKTILLKYLNKTKTRFILTFVFFISAFGVYLGRFLRYNSWEILTNPKVLFIDIINMIMQPLGNKQVWLFTLLFGAFFILGYWVFTNINKDTHQE